jgi:hypothetical protein
MVVKYVVVVGAMGCNEQTPKSGWQLSKQCSFDTPQ